MPKYLVVILLTLAHWPVYPAQANISDFLIKTEVEALFLKSSAEPWRIKVDVQVGVVTLSGRVKSQNELEEFLNTAKSAPGVRRVIDRIRVLPDAEKESQLFTESEKEESRAAVFRLISLAIIGFSFFIMLLTVMLWWFTRFLSLLDKARRKLTVLSWRKERKNIRHLSVIREAEVKTH